MSYEDRALTCQDCGQPFTFSADDQAFHAEKGFTMIPSVAPLAERYGATSGMVVTAKARVRCIPWSAPNAARMRRFRSSPVATARSTVAIASANSGQPHGRTGNSAGSQLQPAKPADM